jgi:hypothetical protein
LRDFSPEIGGGFLAAGQDYASRIMWGRRKGRANPVRPAGPRPLRDAMRDARIEAAERTGVVVDLHDAEVARLELVNDELAAVFAEIPDGVDLFDRGISRGNIPRLWIDAIAHIEMGRDKRMYRFVQDSRLGRLVLAESLVSRDIVDAVTKYIARRMIERERALVGEEPRGPAPARRRPRVVLTFVLGAIVGIAALLGAAWIAASMAPGP